MYVAVCRECFNFKTEEAERKQQSNDIQVIKFTGDEEDEKLLSITKSSTS